MFCWLFENYSLYYDQSKYDTNALAGYGKSSEYSPVGLKDGSFPIYIKVKEKDVDEELENIKVDDVNLSSKIGPSIAQKSDTGHFRVDNASFVSNSRLSLAEETESKNPARRGMSPYRYKGMDGMPLGTGNVRLTTGPAKKTGTQYGTSRAPIKQIDNPLFFGDEPEDPGERAYLQQFRDQQLKLKELNKSLNEIENK